MANENIVKKEKELKSLSDANQLLAEQSKHLQELINQQNIEIQHLHSQKSTKSDEFNNTIKIQLQQINEYEINMKNIYNEKSLMQNQLNELIAQKELADKKDIRRVTDLQSVNDQLLRFARDRKFQELIQRPNVKRALECWSGNTNSNFTEAQMDEIRYFSLLQNVFLYK